MHHTNRLTKASNVIVGESTWKKYSDLKCDLWGLFQTIKNVHYIRLCIWRLMLLCKCMHPPNKQPNKRSLNLWYMIWCIQEKRSFQAHTGFLIIQSKKVNNCEKFIGVLIIFDTNKSSSNITIWNSMQDFDYIQKKLWNTLNFWAFTNRKKNKNIHSKSNNLVLHIFLCFFVHHESYFS